MIYEAGEYHLNDGQMTFLYLLAYMFFFFYNHLSWFECFWGQMKIAFCCILMDEMTKP